MTKHDDHIDSTKSTHLNAIDEMHQESNDFQCSQSNLKDKL